MEKSSLKQKRLQQQLQREREEEERENKRGLKKGPHPFTNSPLTRPSRLIVSLPPNQAIKDYDKSNYKGFKSLKRTELAL